MNLRLLNKKLLFPNRNSPINTDKVIMWDVVTRDYSKWMTAEDVVNNVKQYARNGSIITFHDSLKSIEKLKTALPQAIEWLMEQGYEFKTFE